MLSDLGHDARLGLRGLLRDRGFALAALLSIGLGVGANAAIFSLVDQALFRLLPVSEPERLVLLDWRGTFVGYGWGTSNLMSFPFYQQVRAENEVFDGVFGRHPTLVNLAVETTPEPVSAEIVTGSYFAVLGVRPFLGRLIADSDDLEPGAHPVVAVSYDYWRTRLGAARDIIGRTVRVNNHPMTVIGVAEPGFHGIDWGEVPSLWIPTMMKRQATPSFDWLLDRRGRWLHVFGRLKPGVTVQQAKAGLQPWFTAMLVDDTRREDWPRVSDEQRRRFLASTLDVVPASHGRSDMRGRLQRPLVVLLAATALILLLACLNVANLCLARGFARRKEAALQLALGASRGRVARALLVQSGFVALGGAALGILLAPLVIRALISFLPESAAAVDLSSDINPRVLLFAIGLAMLTTVLFGLAPAVQAAGARPGLVLKEDSGTIGTGIGLRKALVIGQIALALVLLIGAGLFVRTLITLRAKGPGFITTNQVMVSIDPARNGYSLPESDRLIRILLGNLRSLPEVESAGLAIATLLAGGSWNQPLTLEARQRLVTRGAVHCNAVSAGFFETLGVRVVAGRDFNERDSHDVDDLVSSSGPQTNARTFRSAIINQSLARRYFGDVNPVGARLGIGDRPDTKANVVIVGVVEDFSYRGLREMDDQVFFPYFEGGGRGGTFWVRTRTSSQAAIAAVRAAVKQLDPSLPIRPLTVNDQLDRLLVNERLLASLASAFAAVAILLAMIGVYGVMSFVVTGRTREIGIRLALGASSRATVWLILRDGIIMLVGAISLALPVVWGLGRFIESQLFGVRAMDWPTMTAAAVVIALVALAASGMPVRRAVSVSPVEALRYQ
jgi:predicted permease